MLCVCCRVQERVLELETRVRTLLEEKERTEQGKSMSEKRLIELSTQLMRVLGLDASGSPDRELDRVLVKVSEVIQENAILKGKVVNMQAQMSDLEKEHHQHRDTVQQLMRQLQGVPDVTEEKRLLREARALLSPLCSRSFGCVPFIGNGARFVQSSSALLISWTPLFACTCIDHREARVREEAAAARDGAHEGPHRDARQAARAVAEEPRRARRAPLQIRRREAVRDRAFTV